VSASIALVKKIVKRLMLSQELKVIYQKIMRSMI
jgi:hypothetical protein